MASTLQNFGVPLPGAAGQGMLQPKPKYRFRVLASNFGPVNPQQQLDLTRQVASVGKPSVSFESVPVDSYNSKMWYAGKHTWETLQLTLRDDITNTVVSLVNYQVQKQLNHFEQTGFSAGVDYKFQLLLQMMDGSDTGVLEQWFLEGCFITQVQYGELEYSASDPTIITLTIQFDNATDGDGTTEEGIGNNVMPDPALPTGTGPILG